MKDFIIAIFSPLLQLNVIVSTIGGFILGGIMGGLGGSLFGGPSFNTTTAMVGAVIAFTNAAIVSGAGLALDRIRELLEDQTSLLQEQERRQRSQSSSTVANPISFQAARPTPVVQPAGTARKKRKCPDCGAETYDTVDYCPRCSARMT